MNTLSITPPKSIIIKFQNILQKFGINPDKFYTKDWSIDETNLLIKNMDEISESFTEEEHIHIEEYITELFTNQENVFKKLDEISDKNVVTMVSNFIPFTNEEKENIDSLLNTSKGSLYHLKSFLDDRKLNEDGIHEHYDWIEKAILSLEEIIDTCEVNWNWK